MVNEKDTNSRVAIITGSARGIGFEIAKVLGTEGYAVMLSDVNEDGLTSAKIELDKAANMKEQEARRLTLIAQQAVFDYNTALQNYYNERENFKLSEKVLNKTTVKFTEGMVSSLDLSIINNQYLQAQLSYATAIQELLTKKVALDKAYNKLNY